MKNQNWERVQGVIVRGHQVASGRAIDSPYPAGTIALQVPIFQQFGLDLTEMYQATLNLSIHPQRFRLVAPEFTLPHVSWSDRHPPETFSFSRCRLHLPASPSQDTWYDGWIYYPHPETKQRHFQTPSLIEILAPFIPEIQYGCRMELMYNPKEVTVDCPS